MLQQTQVKTVLPYWERWMRELPTIKTLAMASPEKIQKLWEGLGYYTRVRNLQTAAKFIVQRHGGKFPESFDDVLDLPGIGRYTAGAICSIAFNQAMPILDGNVIRVLTRVFGIGKNPREKKTNAQLWQLAAELVQHAAASPIISRRRREESPFNSQRLLTSSPTCSNLNQSLMELGALVCTPRLPKCHICPIVRNCVAHHLDRVHKLPNLGPRQASTRRQFVAFVVRRGGRYLVRQRPAGAVNAHLWEFPNIEWNGPAADLPKAASLTLGWKPETLSTLTPLCTLHHSITRYRITLRAYITDLDNASPGVSPPGRWLTIAGLKKLSFPSAHRKILLRFGPV